MIKLIFLLCITCSIFSCNNNSKISTNTTTEKQKEKKEVSDKIVPKSSSTFFTATVNDKPFAATNEVIAIYNEFGKYYTIIAQNDEFTITIDIPENKEIGSFTCEGRVMENKTRKNFNADAAAVTIEEKTDSHISGSFTMLAADADGNIQSVKEGKFKAFINKN